MVSSTLLAQLRLLSSLLDQVAMCIKKGLHFTLGGCIIIPLLVTGMDDEEDETAPIEDFLNDQKRLRYFKGYLAEVAQAIRYYRHFSSSLIRWISHCSIIFM
jgi:hypothetical protein